MFSLRPAALCVALAAAFPGAAFSAGDADIRQLREQLRELRDSYQQRIDALERRLAEVNLRLSSENATRDLDAFRRAGREHAELSEIVDVFIPIPESHELVQLVATSVVLQQLAYQTAVALERDVDQPRNLAKSVTVE